MVSNSMSIFSSLFFSSSNKMGNFDVAMKVTCLLILVHVYIFASALMREYGDYTCAYVKQFLKVHIAVNIRLIS